METCSIQSEAAEKENICCNPYCCCCFPRCLVPLALCLFVLLKQQTLWANTQPYWCFLICNGCVMPEHLNSRIVLIVILAWPCLYREAEGSGPDPCRGNASCYFKSDCFILFFIPRNKFSCLSKEGSSDHPLCTYCSFSFIERFCKYLFYFLL